MRKRKFKSTLHEMASTTPTDLWNDSCSVQELTFAINHGAVGATTNPVIVSNVLEKEMYLWEARIHQLIEENPMCTEDDIAWKLIQEMAVEGAKLLKRVFDREKRKKGRISIQTDPKYYRNAKLITKQAEYLDSLAPNMQVKIPVTKAGIKAIEEATYQGVNINATVSFTVSQSVAAAEAVERGLRRREAEGKEVLTMSPVCTIMVGRLDDWLRVVAQRDHIITDPGYLNWAGVAVMKKTYRIFKERGYQSRLLSAAYRCHMHWSEFIGGDIIVSIPYEWQKLFNASGVTCVPRMDNPVNSVILDELLRKFVEFRKAYDEDGLTVEEFDTFGATRRTLRQFIAGYDTLVHVIRDRMIPNPDEKHGEE
jgi:transaldolase